MLTKLKQYIGDKKFYKMTFAIIIPIMLQQLLLSVAGYIDSLMINGYGTTSAAYDGVSAANRLIFIFNFIWLGFAATASIFIAQFFGAKNKDKVRESFQLAIVNAIVIGFISFLFIHFLGNKIVDLYISDPISRQYGYDYLKIFKWGTIITAINLALANSFHSIEKPKIALFASMAGIITNCFLNYCLIFGKFGFPSLAAKGAALATILSRVIEFLVFLIILVINKFEYLNRSCFTHFKIRKNLLKEFFKKGTPIIVNELMWSLGISLFALFYTYKNDVWYNAYAISQNVTDLYFIIFAGLGNGSAVIIGASLGNDEFEKAKTDSKRLQGLAIIMGLIMGVLMVLTGPLVMKLFKTTTESEKMVKGIMIVTAIFLAIYSYNSICFFILRAGGDSLRAFLLDQLPTYLVGLPIAIILGLNATKLGLNLVTLFLATHAGDVCKIFVSTWFVRKEKWVVNITKLQNYDI